MKNQLGHLIRALDIPSNSNIMVYFLLYILTISHYNVALLVLLVVCVTKV